MSEEPLDRRDLNMDFSEVRRYLNEIRMPSSMCNTIEALIQYRERTKGMSTDHHTDGEGFSLDDEARELGLE